VIYFLEPLFTLVPFHAIAVWRGGSVVCGIVQLHEGPQNKAKEILPTKIREFRAGRIRIKQRYDPDLDP